MTLQQRSKSELSRLDAIFAELGSGEAPVINGRRDLDDICRQRRDAECSDSSRMRQVGDCGKAGYSSRKAALRTARIRMSSGACRLRVYHCPDCKTFHLTHSIGERLKSSRHHDAPRRHALHQRETIVAGEGELACPSDELSL